MLDSEIKKNIDILNRKKNYPIFLQPISQFVDFAEVWDIISKNQISNILDNPYKFYFIKNEKDTYTSAVLDMGNKDLHWFTLKNHRRKGALKNALLTSILPHLFLTRTFQKISINAKSIGLKNYEASLKLALSLGFRNDKKHNIKGNEVILKIGNSKFKNSKLNYYSQNKISREKLEQIKKKINFHVLNLKHLESEVRLSLPEDITLIQFTKTIENLEKFVIRIEDIFYKT